MEEENVNNTELKIERQFFLEYSFPCTYTSLVDNNTTIMNKASISNYIRITEIHIANISFRY